MRGRRDALLDTPIRTPHKSEIRCSASGGSGGAPHHPESVSLWRAIILSNRTWSSLPSESNQSVSQSRVNQFNCHLTALVHHQRHVSTILMIRTDHQSFWSLINNNIQKHWNITLHVKHFFLNAFNTIRSKVEYFVWMFWTSKSESIDWSIIDSDQ